MDQRGAASGRQHCNPLEGGFHYSNGNPYETTAPGEWWDWVDYEKPRGDATSLIAAEHQHTNTHTQKVAGKCAHINTIIARMEAHT